MPAVVSNTLRLLPGLNPEFDVHAVAYEHRRHRLKWSGNPLQF
jgi:hypothetical protein